MKMKFLTTSFLWILAILASANDGVYYVSGNQIVPLQETDVAVPQIMNPYPFHVCFPCAAVHFMVKITFGNREDSVIFWTL